MPNRSNHCESRDSHLGTTRLLAAGKIGLSLWTNFLRWEAPDSSLQASWRAQSTSGPRWGARSSVLTNYWADGWTVAI